MVIETLGAITGAGGAGGLAKGKMLDLMAPGGGGLQQVASPKLEARFREAMANANGGIQPATSTGSSTMRTMLNTLDQVNGQARSVSEYAATAEASGGQLTPGEIVQLTMRCNEFMFQCQLTSNIANRSSDGVQQLFRQQG
jgi:hypothetical protein